MTTALVVCYKCLSSHTSLLLFTRQSLLLFVTNICPHTPHCFCLQFTRQSLMFTITNSTSRWWWWATTLSPPLFLTFHYLCLYVHLFVYCTLQVCVTVLSSLTHRQAYDDTHTLTHTHTRGAGSAHPWCRARLLSLLHLHKSLKTLPKPGPVKMEV